MADSEHEEEEECEEGEDCEEKRPTLEEPLAPQLRWLASLWRRGR
jgi:hypothetical protein